MGLRLLGGNPEDMSKTSSTCKDWDFVSEGMEISVGRVSEGMEISVGRFHPSHAGGATSRDSLG
jgi:hypothetical protein